MALDPNMLLLLIIVLIVLVIIDLVFKAIGMWRAGRNNQLAWFVCIFIFNTAGILPMIYLSFYQKNLNDKKLKIKIKSKPKK